MSKAKRIVSCGTCGHIHSSADARAVGRFTPSGPLGFRATFDGAPRRATRAEAMTDACSRRTEK